MSSTRNHLIRSIVGLTGDTATGIAMASACAWLVQTAALGVFLSFLVWLLGFVMWLAISQHAVHPLLAALLSDRKLDRGLRVSADAVRAATVAGMTFWGYAQQVGMDLRSFKQPT